MPAWGLVLAHVENALARGIDERAAESIFRYVTSEAAAPTQKQQQQLASISEIFLHGGAGPSFFTKEGAARWRDLTGITKQTPHQLRASLKQETERIAAKYRVARRGSRVEVLNAGLSVAEIARRKETQPKRPTLSDAEARRLALPRIMLEQALAHPGLRTLEHVMAQLRKLEASGYADGALSVDDKERADPTLRGIIDKLHERHGARRHDLDFVEQHLGTAIIDFLYGGRLGSNRRSEPHQRLTTMLAEDAVAFLASDYHRRVVSEHEPFSLVLESFGFPKARDKGRIQPLLQSLLPKPTLDQIEALYSRTIAGELSVLAFYSAAQLDVFDLFQLQDAFPERFPRDGIKNNAAIRGRQTDAEISPAELRRLWNREVASGDKDVTEFCRDHGVPYNAVMHLRRTKEELAKPPAGGVSKTHPKRDEQRAAALRAAMDRAFEKDVLMSIDDAIGRVNQDRVYTKAHKRITKKQYYQLRANQARIDGVAFPNYGSTEHWHPVVAEEIERIFGKNEEITRKELLRDLQRMHPRLTERQLAGLSHARPDLPLPGKRENRTTSEVRKDAARVADMMRAGMPRDEVAAQLQREGKAIDVLEINRMISNHRDLFVGVPTVRSPSRYQGEYRSLISRRLLDLVVRVAPPGTGPEKLAEVWNELLTRAGLPPRDMTKIAPRLRIHTSTAPAKVLAGVLAEVFAEYAAAAKRGTSEEQIVENVLADYPLLNQRHLGSARRFWNQAPGDYPQLAALRNDRGKVELTGKRDPKKPLPSPEQRKYLGGFDIDRVLAHATKEEELELAKLSEAAHVPLALEEVELVAELLAAGKPLAMKNVLWVSHMLGDVVPVAYVLKKAGATSKNMIVVSSPYGANELVSDSIKEIGFEQRTPRLERDEYRKVVKQALIDLIERHQKNKHPIVVMDDGGLVADIVHQDLAKDPKYAPYVDQIRIVEQTKNGLLLADRNELLTILVAVAIADIKKLEGDAIGEVVGTHVGRRLTHRTGGVKRKRVVVFGHGIIGAPTARVLAAQGAKVTVVETGPEAAAEARQMYPSHHVDAKLFERDSPEGSKELMAVKKALASADYVVGASGSTSMKLWMFDAMKDGATWANISSKRHEGEIEALEHKAEKEILEKPNPLQTLPDASYTYAGKTIYVDGDGWPFTLNGTVQHVPPERIQFTDAGMVAGLFQICKAYRRRGLEKLAPKIDRLLSEHLIAKRPSFPSLPIYDANQWRDTIRDISLLCSQTSARSR